MATFLKELPFKVDPENAEISLLAESILKNNSIDKDIENALFKFNYSDKGWKKHPTKENHVVIVGAGPLGQLAAIRAIKSGKKVTLVELRKGYSREYSLGINDGFLGDLRVEAPNLTKQMELLRIFQDRPGWPNLGSYANLPFSSVRTQQLENSLALYLHRFQEMAAKKEGLEDALTIVRGAQVTDIASLPDNMKVTYRACLLYTSPSPRDRQKSRMPSSA